MMNDEKIEAFLKRVDDLFEEAQTTCCRTGFALALGKALGMIEILAASDFISSEDASERVDRLNGLVGLFKLGQLRVKPLKPRTT